AGKAHPKDEGGKELIRQVVALARQEGFRRRLIFLEDYDMAVARFLVQGADVWLNTPRRPYEASGTSGMKAAANGVLNLSTLDGWWDEAWRASDAAGHPIGWAIGRGEAYDDPGYQEQVEAEALYDLLEEDVIPTFYDRSADGLPRRWVGRMRSSVATLCHFFNTHRMVREYAERFYLPAAGRYRELTADGLARARELATWRAHVQTNWPQVEVEPVEVALPPELPVGGEVRVRARVRLGALKPEDVAVQLYLGRVDASGEIVEAMATPMAHVGPDGDGRSLFETAGVLLSRSGLHGYTLRVLPHHPDLATPFLPGLIAWA
ncbi:MAG: alpha-glucan family phosphorylase, partial [Chloroflexi bacterium]|nr:alpha-glucan family phosphorylase [Chloroflexota bacterium]